MDEKEAKELRDTVRASLARLDNLEKANKDLTEANEKLRKDAVEKEEKAKKDAVTAKRAQIDGMFNDAITQKRIEPAIREKFKRFNPYDTKDNVVEGLDIEKDVKSFIDEHAKEADVKIEAARKARGSDGNAGGYDPTKASSEQMGPAVRAACKALVLDPGKYEDLHKATLHVLRTNKELAKAYQYNDGGKAA